MTPPRLLVVPCVDVEGPLDETADVAAAYVAAHGPRNNFLRTWADVGYVLTDAAGGFRSQLRDPQGRPVAYTWFVADFPGYVDNPRRRPVGWLEVWDAARAYLHTSGLDDGDAWGWHMHAVHPTRQATRYSTTWTTRLAEAEGVLCRRLLDRGWFPALFRAGGNVMRNDLSHWLERHIPFDFSSAAPLGGPGAEMDWRMSYAADLYRPRWSDYRKVGDMRRLIARCPDADSWASSLDEAAVAEAFLNAERGVAILAYGVHDRRDFRVQVARIHQLVTKIAGGRPWAYASALEAVRAVTKPSGRRPFAVAFDRTEDHLVIRANDEVFGEPFIAVREGGEVYRDNATQEGPRDWAYKPPAGAEIAVAAVGTDGQVATWRSR